MTSKIEQGVQQGSEADIRVLLCDHTPRQLAAEVLRLRAALRSALDEIEDAGPKALKYAEQEIRKGLADG